MYYNFDEETDRTQSSCVKYELLRAVFGREDILPMWIADMDFKTPDFIINAIKERCSHEILGYTCTPTTYKEAVLSWFERHYQVKSNWKNMHFVPGIVQGIAFALHAFTQPNDKILIATPIYPPFLNVPKNIGRTLVNTKLLLQNGQLEFDFQDLETKAKDCKLMILVNPHNPGGRVWTREDLQKIADICYRHHVLVISDEIHADLTLPSFKHISFSTVSQEAAENSITFFAPSKTFNIPGLASSVCYAKNETIKHQFFNYLDANELSLGNIFAFVGAEAAFRYGEEWLKQLLDYLQANINFVEQYLQTYLPSVKMIKPQASFLIWLDFRQWNMTQTELMSFLTHQAKVGFVNGTDYGTDGIGFMRMNIGCQRRVVQEALERIRKAWTNK